MNWKRTAVTELFNVEVPIVLGPFGGVSSVELAATVSNGGGLGSFGLYGYDADRIRSTAADLAAATDRPFALNLWLPHDGDHDVLPDEQTFASYVDALRPYFDAVGAPIPERPERYLPDFDDQLDAVFEARPAVVSFVFGVPPRHVVDRARDLGIRTVGAATTVAEAIALEAGGVDAVVATGMEAGGHRVSFLRRPEESLVGTFALVPQVADAISIPVIAAGGITDARGIAAALTLGADGVQLGSAFLATEQSAASAEYRAALHAAGENESGTVLTRGPSGRLARGIPNRLTEIVPAAPFPLQNWLTGKFRTVAIEKGRLDLMSLWAGQASPLIRERDAATLLDTLVNETTRLLG